MRDGRIGSGPVVVIRTVRSSTFSAPLMVPKYAICSDLSAGSMMRVTLVTTESALKGSPLVKVMFGLSLNSQVVVVDLGRRFGRQPRHERAVGVARHQRLVDIVVHRALATVVARLRIERRRLGSDGDHDLPGGESRHWQRGRRQAAPRRSTGLSAISSIRSHTRQGSAQSFAPDGADHIAFPQVEDWNGCQKAVKSSVYKSISSSITCRPLCERQGRSKERSHQCRRRGHPNG